MEIGERIRHFRKDVQNMTQEEFSNKINVTRSNIASIEKGRISATDRVISDICTAFSVSERWLRTGEGEMVVETEETLFSSFSRRYDLTEEEQAVARYCLSLSPEQRHDLLQHVLNVADAIKAARPAPEENPDQVETEVEAYRQELKAQEKGLSVSATTKEKRA